MFTRSKGNNCTKQISWLEQDSLRNKLNEGKLNKGNSSSRILRSAGKPTCLHFGVARHTKYPGCYFCSNCDWFEREYRINTKIKLGSSKFKCVAGHDNWIMPSSMIDIVSETVPKKQNIHKRTANRKSAPSVPSMITMKMDLNL
jgi:hypothetical protein